MFSNTFSCQEASQCDHHTLEGYRLMTIVPATRRTLAHGVIALRHASAIGKCWSVSGFLSVLLEIAPDITFMFN